MNRRASNSIHRNSEPATLGNVSATWPTAAELEPGYASIVPEPASRHGFDLSHLDASYRGDLSEFFEPDDNDTLRVFAPAEDRHDTVPAPPPDLESAPWHDER